ACEGSGNRPRPFQNISSALAVLAGEALIVTLVLLGVWKSLRMRNGRSLRRNWLLLMAILVGSGLRLYQITSQIIADDEWHAVHMARDLDFFSIASHFGDADVSIPIALFYRLVITTVGLSEWIMRAPALFFGLLSLIVFPLLVRRFFDPVTSVLFAWLLAISPIH